MDDTGALQNTSLPRRRALYLGVAGAAALGGAAWGWFRLRPHAVQDGAVAALWGLRLDSPAGGALDLATLRGKPLLVNFWATWCPPCVDEMPLLDGFYRENSANGIQVVGIAIDQPALVRNFLAKIPVKFPIGLAGLEGTAVGRALGNETGGLPFSVFLDAAGTVRDRKMGKLEAADLARWALLK